MRRRLFTIFSAVSLLLCVAVMVLWGRSYSVSDVFYSWDERDDSERLSLVEDELRIGKGHIGVSRVIQDGPAADFMKSIPFWTTWPPEHPHFSHAVDDPRGFGFSWGSYRMSRFFARALTVPLWPIVFILAILPARWGWLRWRGREGNGRGFAMEVRSDAIDPGPH